MPDWNYHTVFRPLLSRLPYRTAQRIAFTPIGWLGRSSIGRQVIRFFGHADPDPVVATTFGPWQVRSPVALSGGIDTDAVATAALTQFGFGVIEIGPVAADLAATDADSQPRWAVRGRSVRPEPDAAFITAADAVERIPSRLCRNDVRICARLAAGLLQDSDALQQIVGVLGDHVDGFSCTVPNAAGDGAESVGIQNLVRSIRNVSATAVILLRCDPAHVSHVAAGISELTDSSGVGVLVDFDTLRSEDTAGGLPDIATVVALRAAFPADRPVAASGGVREPRDALHLLTAGFDLSFVSSGFIESGPGLPKRVNQAVAARHRAARPAASPVTSVFHESWFWALLMAIGLTVGGAMALIIGSTRVLLPYDEEFLGMVQEEVCGINDRLLPFMSHDRVTLAGTMLSLGMTYCMLAVWGDRRGMHWARVAIIVSAFSGFISFFLFLGFGYFDPFHAFITAVLFQLLALCARSHGSPPREFVVDLRNTPAWRRAMWGQLLMLFQGGVLIVAGCVISSFGITSVFVEDDLEFMRTTAEALASANPRLVPLIAHDRASFGGMLISTGLAVFLTALWGWQRGRRWLWATFAVSGTVGYVTTIAIHFVVGYTSANHLLPAWLGLGELWLALLLSRSWMFESGTLQSEQSMLSGAVAAGSADKPGSFAGRGG